jgi:hypothetical protein
MKPSALAAMSSVMKNADFRRDWQALPSGVMIFPSEPRGQKKAFNLLRVSNIIL